MAGNNIKSVIKAKNTARLISKPVYDNDRIPAITITPNPPIISIPVPTTAVLKIV